MAEGRGGRGHVFQFGNNKFGEKLDTWAKGAGAHKDELRTTGEEDGARVGGHIGGGERTRRGMTGSGEKDTVDWELPPELLDGGQGKNQSARDIVVTTEGGDGNGTRRITDGSGEERGGRGKGGEHG